MAAVAVVAAVAAGCGRDEPDLVNGKELFFEARCASCHVLRRANATGVVGPNLDSAFGPSRDNGLGEDTIAGVVEDQIANPLGPQMPANLVTGDDARDVAAYVAEVAGMPGQDTGALAQVGPQQSTQPAVARNGTLDIPADPSGNLAFRFGRATAEAGRIQFRSPNPSSVQHNIAVRGPGIQPTLGPVVGQGGVSQFSAQLRPGRYTFFCSVPGHEAGGMKGDLTVE